MASDLDRIRAESRRWYAARARAVAQQLEALAASAADWGVPDLPARELRACVDALTRWADEQERA